MANNYSIVVSVNGSVGRRSNNEITARKENKAGEYTVAFPEPVKNWLWLATLAPTDATTQAPGFITVEQEAMTDATLRVRTWNAGAAAPQAIDRPFHLLVREMGR